MKNFIKTLVVASSLVASASRPPLDRFEINEFKQEFYQASLSLLSKEAEQGNAISARCYYSFIDLLSGRQPRYTETAVYVRLIQRGLCKSWVRTIEPFDDALIYALPTFHLDGELPKYKDCSPWQKKSQ